MWKVMAADDEAYMRDLLEYSFDWKKYGCELVRVLSDGRKLIAAIKEDTPDIVLTDIKMPVVDGVQVCKFLAENYPDVQVIIVTAFSDFEYAKSAIKYNVCDYVLKLEVLDDLGKALEKAIGRLKSLSDAEYENFYDKAGDVYTQINRYIDEHYADKITVEKIAQLMCYNESYISRVYKEKSGINLVDAIQQRRIIRAKDYLVNTNMKIYEISQKLSFSDVGYFSRVFKKFVGVSPTEFQQQMARQHEK